MELCEVVCPTCFEPFEVLAPVVGDAELPAELDYDCAVCCRPMMIIFEVSDDEGGVSAMARGLGE